VSCAMELKNKKNTVDVNKISFVVYYTPHSSR